MKALIWIEVGGESGSWKCKQMDYAICNGNTKEELLKDWIYKNYDRNLFFDEIVIKDNRQTWMGRCINIFELPTSFEENTWKHLYWGNELC